MIVLDSLQDVQSERNIAHIKEESFGGEGEVNTQPPQVTAFKIDLCNTQKVFCHVDTNQKVCKSVSLAWVLSMLCSPKPLVSH